MSGDETATPADRLALADWRRRVGELYAEVRRVAAADPAAAWERWREEREALFRGHPQSPLPVAERTSFRARHWPYDEALRFESALERPAADEREGTARPRDSASLAVPRDGDEVLSFAALGTVRLSGGAARRTLTVYWMAGYAGGLFLPFRDATNGGTTYGAGRYVLDTAKGADLGTGRTAGTLVVDLNFAYHPSCAWDARWSCPLAPVENRLAEAVEAGERLR